MSEPLISEPRLEGAYDLGRGRRLGFAEYGAPDGEPVFWFHGTPGGRRQVPPAARDLSAEFGVRLIALERPGIGASTPHRYDAIREWGDDVGAIADGLGLEQFACVGLSGGGPYVLACAAANPERMRTGLVLGGVAPAVGPDAVPGGLVGFARRFTPLFAHAHEPLGRLLHAAVFSLRPAKDQAMNLYIGISPEGDKRVFAKPEIRHMFIDDLLGASRRQLHAPVLDVRLFLRDWGFSLGEIAVPIHFFQGDADQIVPLGHAEHMVARVPGASLRIRPGESHLGALDASEELLEILAGHLGTGRPLADAAG
jgi:pimeloyl-ACP methyl ester carboxylesterase